MPTGPCLPKTAAVEFGGSQLESATLNVWLVLLDSDAQPAGLSYNHSRSLNCTDYLYSIKK